MITLKAVWVGFGITRDNAPSPLSLDIGDVNNDGLNDVVVGNFRANPDSSTIGVFLQNASATMDAMQAMLTPNSCSVKISDLNNDGLKDIVGLSWGYYNDYLDVFRQNPAGGFYPPDTYIVEHDAWSCVTTADVNNDGRDDIIATTGSGLSTNSIAILYQNTGGYFDAPAYLSINGATLCGITAADINHDGRNDIIVTYGGNRPDSCVGILLQNASGTLESPIILRSYDCPSSVVVTDIDSNGKNDIITLHSGWRALGIYFQDCSGTFFTYQLFSIPYSSYGANSLAVADINNDGKKDVVIVGRGCGLVILYQL